jgi:hypothetical protein
MKVDDDICWNKYNSIDENSITDWQPKMRSTLASLAMIVSKTYANQRAVIERNPRRWMPCYAPSRGIKQHHTWGQC